MSVGSKIPGARDKQEYPKCTFKLPSGYKKSKCIHKEDVWLKCETQHLADPINGTDHPIKDCSKWTIFIFYNIRFVPLG